MEANSSLWSIARDQLNQDGKTASNADVLSYMRQIADKNGIALDEKNNIVNMRDVREGRELDIPSYDPKARVGAARAPTADEKSLASKSTMSAGALARDAQSESLLRAKVTPRAEAHANVHWNGPATIVDGDGIARKATGVRGADAGVRASIGGEVQRTLAGTAKDPKLSVAVGGTAIARAELAYQGWQEDDAKTGRSMRGGKVGAYAGASLTADGALRARYLDIEGGIGPSFGVGGRAAAAAGRERNGLYSAGGDLAITGVAAHGRIALKTDAIQEDVAAVEKKVEDTWNAAAASISKTWSALNSEEGLRIGS